MSHTKPFRKNLVRQWVGRIRKKTPESVGEIPLQREVSVCMEGNLQKNLKS